MIVRKTLKVIGILIAIVLVVILLLMGSVWGIIAWTRYSKNQEAIRYQKEVCDTIKTVEGNYEIKVNGFSPKELRHIKFYLKRDRLIIRDTLINFTAEDDYETQTFIMPFERFNIDDEIIVVIKTRTYLLSGYNYVAVHNYGMFGPVGPCECGAQGYKIINGKPAGYGWLLRKNGLLDYQLPAMYKQQTGTLSQHPQ